MHLSLKKTVFVFAAVSFALMASGLTLYLHVAGSSDAEHHHDVDNCPLCQKLLVAPSKFMLPTSSNIAWDFHLCLIKLAKPTTPLSEPSHLLPRGRAPPQSHSA